MTMMSRAGWTAASSAVIAYAGPRGSLSGGSSRGSRSVSAEGAEGGERQTGEVGSDLA